jgi:hypothetical protein
LKIKEKKLKADDLRLRVRDVGSEFWDLGLWAGSLVSRVYWDLGLRVHGLGVRVHQLRVLSSHLPGAAWRVMWGVCFVSIVKDLGFKVHCFGF